MADPLTEAIAARRAAEAELAAHDSLDDQAERTMRELLARRAAGPLTTDDAARLRAASARLADSHLTRDDLARQLGYALEEEAALREQDARDKAACLSGLRRFAAPTII